MNKTKSIPDSSRFFDGFVRYFIIQINNTNAIKINNIINPIIIHHFHLKLFVIVFVVSVVFVSAVLVIIGSVVFGVIKCKSGQS